MRAGADCRRQFQLASRCSSPAAALFSEPRCVLLSRRPMRRAAIFAAVQEPLASRQSRVNYLMEECGGRRFLGLAGQPQPPSHPAGSGSGASGGRRAARVRRTMAAAIHDWVSGDMGEVWWEWVGRQVEIVGAAGIDGRAICRFTGADHSILSHGADSIRSHSPLIPGSIHNQGSGALPSAAHPSGRRPLNGCAVGESLEKRGLKRWGTSSPPARPEVAPHLSRPPTSSIFDLRPLTSDHVDPWPRFRHAEHEVHCRGRATGEVVAQASEKYRMIDGLPPGHLEQHPARLGAGGGGDGGGVCGGVG